MNYQIPRHWPKLIRLLSMGLPHSLEFYFDHLSQNENLNLVQGPVAMPLIEVIKIGPLNQWNHDYLYFL